MSGPTIGQIVHYTLSENDARLINARRTAYPNIGNSVSAGLDYPAMVVAAWGRSSCNLQVHLDGADSYWATSRSEGDEPGHWHWPPQA